MSVWVRGMKMPESCHVCVAGYGGFCFEAPPETEGKCPDSGKPDWCPLVEAPEWISVKERLPEEKTYVLILTDTIAGKMEKVSFLYKDSESKNCWTALDEYGKNLFDWQPTHWMPLPEPPKEE